MRISPFPRHALLGALAGTPLLARPALAQPRTVTDVNGRAVRLAGPAQRVVLGFYFEDVTVLVLPRKLVRWERKILGTWSFPRLRSGVYASFGAHLA